MPVQQKKPTSPGMRFQVADTYEDITKNKPEKSLIHSLKKHAGRGFKGRISMRHRGGGNKRKYRIIDFKRDKDGIKAKVSAIEYDPNRNCRIALLEYEDSEKRYILAPLNFQVGAVVESGPLADIQVGNALPLKNIPIGTVIHNIEMRGGEGGKIARAAGAAVSLVAKEGEYAILKMPSGEQRMIHLNCRATIGQLGNIDAKNVVLGKAGKKRHLGRRPEVRGVVMNPCDHPHGGGEGKSGIGRIQPVSKWGQPALGYKTRRGKRNSDRFILTRRK
ncbi:MAG: large subunit ribosomal protein L2 [Candidatus Saganbacteria bacterium]|uniref:Large ribosomal subunit protein uL2 n=1 Tax=Candidatus Saganbacteria bacterium TaxID=2575572 RepID=A0A833P385_UNCSA|nr:MAG: large subunit ribosomal protein L2 [Candidatus Saganbacteria bacterium]